MTPTQVATRFAPSATGDAHPGTLLSGLLCWLDARSRGATIDLRLEDLDPERCRPEYVDAIRRALEWLGLDWDREILQSGRDGTHAAALDRLAAAGLLYPCECSRARLRGLGRPAPDGGFAYDNRCRTRRLPPGGWRDSREPVRLRLPDEAVEVIDEAGTTIRQRPARDVGDPVVVRRDGAVAYHLASVADDAEAGYGRLIRGRDLATSAPTQWLLYDLLGAPRPTIRHHFLLLERRGGKLAKLHGAVGAAALADAYAGPDVCALLARWAGISATEEAVRPAELLPKFDWARVREADLAVDWDGRRLRAAPPT